MLGNLLGLMTTRAPTPPPPQDVCFGKIRSAWHTSPQGTSVANFQISKQWITSSVSRMIIPNIIITQYLKSVIWDKIFHYISEYTWIHIRILHIVRYKYALTLKCQGSEVSKFLTLAVLYSIREWIGYKVNCAHYLTLSHHATYWECSISFNAILGVFNHSTSCIRMHISDIMNNAWSWMTSYIDLSLTWKPYIHWDVSV